jgi:hypothetical protein
LWKCAGKYLPDPPDGSSWSLFDGSVKVPQTMKIGDMTDADSLTLNASYKVIMCPVCVYEWVGEFMGRPGYIRCFKGWPKKEVDFMAHLWYPLTFWSFPINL